MNSRATQFPHLSNSLTRKKLLFLAWAGDFHLDRGEHVGEVHLASRAALDGFAGRRGTYFFCGEGGEGRSILHAASDGGAALVATGLSEVLRLLLVAL
ncbi:hypothetical protein ACFYNY_20615 [Streptomyces sp. NPDC006530]|uniref:hypothetical protein n=1 Tax=Streptomyces sp. NPDC006530 TaxID=3364750 RepID=UPI0036805EA3